MTRIDHMYLEGRGRPLTMRKSAIEACVKGNPALLQEALDQGADPDGLGETGEPLLIECARRGHPEHRQELFEVILSFSADPNLSLPAKDTPMHRLAAMDEPELLGVAIAFGGHPDVLGVFPGDGGDKLMAPLHVAILANKPACAAILVEEGADAFADSYPDDPLDGKAPCAEPAIFLAARSPDKACLEQICSYLDLSDVAAEDARSLFAACSSAEHRKVLAAVGLSEEERTPRPASKGPGR